MVINYFSHDRTVTNNFMVARAFKVNVNEVRGRVVFEYGLNWREGKEILSLASASTNSRALQIESVRTLTKELC